MEDIYASNRCENPDVERIVNELTVNEKFPLLAELKSVLRKYAATVFTLFDQRGMLVPPMHLELKEGAVLKTQPCRYVNPAILELCGILSLKSLSFLEKSYKS